MAQPKPDIPLDHHVKPSVPHVARAGFYDKDILVPLALTYLAKSAAALGGLFLAIVLGRLYGPGGMGAFALAQSLLLGASIIARYGLDKSLIRYVGQDHESLGALVYLHWALLRAGMLSLIFAIAVFVMRTSIDQLFGVAQLKVLLTGVALSIPAFTLSFVLGGFFKGIRKPVKASLLENGSMSMVAAVIIVCWEWLRPGAGIANVGWALAMSSWIVLLNGVLQVISWSRSEKNKKSGLIEPKKQFMESASAFFVASFAQFMQQVVSVLVAGWILSSDELGLFRAAERTAVLINFSLLVINAVLPPRFASLYRHNDIDALGMLARKGAMMGVVASAPFLLLCIFAPEYPLGLFGEDFSQAVHMLRIIAIAQLINVVTGSVGFILNMTGHEKLMRNISLACNLIGLLALLVLTPILGALGAAIALSLILILQNCCALVFVWRKLGIWVVPYPNILSLVKVNS